MVACGIGVTVMPMMARPEQVNEGLLVYVPFEPPAPQRRVSLVWRKSFPRLPAIEALRRAILSAGLQGVTLLRDAKPQSH